ncbi:nucleotide-sugar transporter [Skeletonema marinoi]|uniref:Nucleotide-sugar transporter n=2 Tax=Skeletonema marinoi TaxID=267567 RepID=A0AAD9D6V0_9STRA|nr:nucleotide-sugar transporter [Skeletonema marinoi]
MENEEKVVEKNAQQPEDSSSTMSATVTATAGETKTTKNEKMFRLFLLFMMTAQNSTVVLVSRYTRAGVSNEDSYVINDLIMVQEFGKLILAAALEYNATNGQLVRSMKENIFDRPKDFFRILIPSLLYLVQNSLLYVAISNLTAPMFQVTYQCKLLTTAVVSVIMLQRKYSLKQWLCLTALGIGVAIVVLGAQSDSKKDASDSNEEGEDANVQNLFVGLMSVTIACLCSAFAGVYFEFVLKRPTNDGGEARAPVSMWMRNVQMAFFSICIAYINMVRDSDRGVTGLVDENNDPVIKPFMHGFTGWVYVVVMLQAGGGLLVAAVIKYADNVLKGMATGVSVVTATFFSMFLFGTSLSIQFAIGAGVILVSVYLFSNDIPAMCKGKVKQDEHVEMSPMLPK